MYSAWERYWVRAEFLDHYGVKTHGTGEYVLLDRSESLRVERALREKLAEARGLPVARVRLLEFESAPVSRAI